MENKQNSQQEILEHRINKRSAFQQDRTNPNFDQKQSLLFLDKDDSFVGFNQTHRRDTEENDLNNYSSKLEGENGKNRADSRHT